MKKLLLLITAVCISVLACAQADCFFTHYSSKDGLSQNTVMKILQDRKGNMWFATWNGLNKFNGYSFVTYKTRPGEAVPLTHDRMDYIHEDGLGYIWILAYDNHVFRFDPRREQYERVPSAEQPAESYAAVRRVKPLADGAVWLLLEREGATRISTDSLTHALQPRTYSRQTKAFEVGRVNDVFADSGGNEWLLTENGLGMLAGGSGPLKPFLKSQSEDAADSSPFYACYELGGNLYFGSDRGRLWRYNRAQQEFKLLKLEVGSRVVDLCAVGTDRLLVATATDGLFIYADATGEFRRYTSEVLGSEPVHSVYMDRKGEAWIEQHTPGSVVHFATATGSFKREHIKVEPTSTDRSRPAFHIHEDCNGILWVHPYGGGFSWFDRAANTLRPFHNSLQGGGWRFSNKIHSAFSDRQGNLWMSTHSKGLEKVTFSQRQFELFTPVNHSYESLSNEVRALCEDHRHHVWVGLKDGKLRVYDTDGTMFGYLTEQGTVATTGTPLVGNVYHIMEDSKQNLWISTKGSGLVKAEPAGNLRYRLTRYMHSADDVYSLSNDNVYCTYEDVAGRIWVATFAEGANYLMRNDRGEEVFIHAHNNLKGYPIGGCSKVRYITSDAGGRIWMGTTVGALMVEPDFSRPEEAQFHRYVLSADDPQSLSNNDVHCIHTTRKGEFYLATFGGGLNKLVGMDADHRARFRSYTMADGLPSDILLALSEDRHGNLWMSTENGVSKFIPGTEVFENYNDINTDINTRFSEAATCCTHEGRILFGTNAGVLALHPDSLGKSRFCPPIALSRLLIANKVVTPGPQSVLGEGPDYIRKLRLSHHENIFTLQYAALDYTAPADIQYAYMLEGFDEDWNYVVHQRMATYTNLPKGHYVFKVRSTNADGVWADNVRTLPIDILPSFWETPFAYFLYVLLVLLVIVVAVYILFTIYRLKHEVTIEQKVTDVKLRFFTDISHELRTPLTLIAGPVENVMNRTDLPADVRGQLQVVERNTNRMLRLINQILDFRKIQNRKMRMQVQRVDIVPLTRKIMENYDSVADEHHIDYLLEAEQESLFLWVDADKYEKILFNLLSNAFKYTPAGRMIKVFIHDNGESVEVGVHDQGIGIPENRRKSLFVRFENMVERNYFNQSSTGIGLSLVKELVEMHHAGIRVDSKVGEGSCFYVTFLKGKDHYDESVEFVVGDATPAMAEVMAPAVPADGLDGGDEADTDAGTKPTMLLVEDNVELRNFICSLFKDRYRVVEAADGVQGVGKALKYQPDIIISDVMMPGKDGIAMLRDLRADFTTSHIPVVLLTAKTSIESMLEGMEYGADDYITKPFSATYLQARVRNLLLQRSNLQERFRHQAMPLPAVAGEAARVEMSAGAQPQTPEMSAADRKFLDTLVELMEKNMDNGDLVVDDLVKELAVSRSVFFKKLKSLTGLAPIEFIREMRISRAVRLIETGEYSMTQIAYMVGINDPRYFSKCFKQKMGMTPTEYKERCNA